MACSHRACRLAASVCEAHHDDYGPIWPMAIAPWQVHICAVRADDAEVKEKVQFIPVANLSEVLKHALVRSGRTPARAARGVPQATSLIANEKPADAHKEPTAVM